MAALRQWFAHDSFDWVHRNYVIDWFAPFSSRWEITDLTLTRVFALGFWLISYLIAFIPIFERDIPLKDESIDHKHTHEQ